MELKSVIRISAVTVGLTLACVLPAQAAPVLGQGTWESTLLGRDINRNAVSALDDSAVYLYDTTLGVTWLRDANVNGKMTWANATTWAANLSTGTGSATISDWRLPSMSDTGAPGCSTTYGGTECGYNPVISSSEMASLFFGTLGDKSYLNTSGVQQAGYGLTNTGSFEDMQSHVYWLGAGYALNANLALAFNTNFGFQGISDKADLLYAMAVHSGDVLVSAVPEPETYALMLAGLGLIGAVARRSKTKQA